MSAITQFFFRSQFLAEPQNTWSIIQWWETRRPAYNIAVGTAGMLTLATLMLSEGFPNPAGLLAISTAVLAYGFLANLCYTLGPAIDVIIHRTWGDAYDVVGPALFRYGFVFAVGVTLLPIPFIVISRIFRLLMGVGGL